ncbi:MAG: CotH kinase family protein [Pseudomonadota bacterium]|nr:CotH kinase family protein [Pseudomonadota bacterium]
MLLVTALLACTSPDPIGPGPDPIVAVEPETEIIGPAPDSGDTGTEGPDTEDPDGCKGLYDPDVLQDFAIEITPEERAELEDDYARGEKDYHPVVFRHGDQIVEDAMIRLKGNPGFSWYIEKMQFVVAFNEVDSAGRFHGLRKIALDASWYEPTLVRDRVAWQVIRREGSLPFACANSATLTINGEYYGLYSNIEYLDHEWLERSFGAADATGTLWKYGYDPVANEEDSTGAAIARMNDTTDPDALAALGDLDNWIKAWAAEAVLGSDDGYWCCDHNYYLYEHPTRGILFVPWDLDDTFDVMGYDADPVRGYASGREIGLFDQVHFWILANDPAWGPKYVDAVAALNDAMDPDTTIADIDAYEAQIADALVADPNRSFGWEEHVAQTERMRAWVRARHAYLDSWVACQRGSTVDTDGDGSPVCADPDDGDAVVGPSGVEVCNGIDDDADGWIDDDAACDDCVRHDFDARHFTFCRWPRTNFDAEANCQARGGTLTGPETTGEVYVYFFYTWPVREAWWTAAVSGSGRCAAWDEASFSNGVAGCSEEHPSVCAIP